MPASPSSSAQAARQRLAKQLREMRHAARVTGVRFAREAGWADSSLVSAIELGRRTITAGHVGLWCRICGASTQRTEELLAEQAAVEVTWVTYQQLNRGGLRKAQESVRSRYETAKLMRIYQTKVIPGLLQTRAYTTAALIAVRLEQGVEVDDVAGAVDERMDRQSVLNRPDSRWVFLIEEDVLWFRTVSMEVHAGQLRHLLEVMRHPSVSVGIIPRTARRQVTPGWGVWPEESFTMTDSRQVNVELVSGYLTLTQPLEVQAYIKAWERLFALAVHGGKARTLITGALDGLTYTL